MILPLLVAACGAPADQPLGGEQAPGPEHAWTLIVGGDIWTSADADAPVQALLARDGVVVAVGEEGAVETELPPRAQVERIDLAGGVGVPGLVDAHGHLFNLGGLLEDVDLTDCATFGELVERVAAAAARVPAGTWIRGRGWDQTRWPEQEFPHHRDLSAAVPQHPVLLSRVDGHALLVNRSALERAGLARHFEVEPTIPGGRLLLDEGGEPTGVLVDTAMQWVRAGVPALESATLERHALAAQERLLSVGLVAVHEMGLSPEEVAVLEDLDHRGLLKLRIIGYLAANRPLAPTLLARYPGPRDVDPGSTLRIIGAKLMLDGAMGSRGAALLEPYSDAPDQVGLLRMEPRDFRARLDEVVDAGLQPATHAIGDRANRLVLDAYEQRLASDPTFRALRPRVEHAQLIAPEDRGRFVRLGVIPSMQPTHCTSDMRWVDARIGAHRSGGAYAWQTLSGNGAPLALGSDFPVERPDPLEGLRAAITRRDARGQPAGGWHPEESLDASQALAGFTSGAAFAAREERARGRLEPGYRLDMTVLSADPLTAPPEALLAARATRVLIDGEVAWAE